MKIRKLLTMCLLAALPTMGFAQQTFTMNLWTGKASEKSVDKSDTAKVMVFLPEKKKATGRAVVICPGGGYAGLSMQSEGTDWAAFLNNMGIAAFVLKYRLPHGKPEVPVSDAEEAMKLVRRNASAWGINPKDVGIMGFSAGGHLASVLAVHGEKGAKPDFQILFYPVITMMQEFTHQGSHDNLLGTNAKRKKEQQYSSDMHVTRVTPRALIMLCDDDHVVQPSNGVNFYTELYRHDVPASLHVFPDGGHGWGAKIGFKYHLEMIFLLKAWLGSF